MTSCHNSSGSSLNPNLFVDGRFVYNILEKRWPIWNLNNSMIFNNSSLSAQRVIDTMQKEEKNLDAVIDAIKSITFSNVEYKVPENLKHNLNLLKREFDELDKPGKFAYNAYQSLTWKEILLQQVDFRAEILKAVRAPVNKKLVDQIISKISIWNLKEDEINEDEINEDAIANLLELPRNKITQHEMKIAINYTYRTLVLIK